MTIECIPLKKGIWISLDSFHPLKRGAKELLLLKSRVLFSTNQGHFLNNNCTNHNRLSLRQQTTRGQLQNLSSAVRPIDLDQGSSSRQLQEGSSIRFFTCKFATAQPFHLYLR